MNTLSPKHFFWIVFLISIHVTAQHNSWQQQADYEMALDMDVNTFRFSGIQKLTYTNNSPDTLDRVFYHMYFNAFQPGSEILYLPQVVIDFGAFLCPVNELGQGDGTDA